MVRMTPQEGADMLQLAGVESAGLHKEDPGEGHAGHLIRSGLRKGHQIVVLLLRPLPFPLDSPAGMAAHAVGFDRKPQFLVPESLFLREKEKPPAAIKAAPLLIIIVRHRHSGRALPRQVGSNGSPGNESGSVVPWAAESTILPCETPPAAAS